MQDDKINMMSPEKPAASCGQVDELVIRPLLQDWFNDNVPDEKWRFANAAQNQIMWVRDCFAYLVWNCLLAGKDTSFAERMATLTVDGTHTSKSVKLPVYRIDVSGVTIKARGNFHDWCVRCWGELNKPFPEYMKVAMEEGYFEGMSGEDSPISFCVRSREQLHAVTWWLLNEGLNV